MAKMIGRNGRGELICKPEAFRRRCGIIVLGPPKEIFRTRCPPPRQNIGNRVSLFLTRLPPAHPLLTQFTPPPKFPSSPRIGERKTTGTKMPQDHATTERLKASLWFSIGKIIDEETTRLNTTATPQFIGAMTEMLWAQIGDSPCILHPILPTSSATS